MGLLLCAALQEPFCVVPPLSRRALKLCQSKTGPAGRLETCVLVRVMCTVCMQSSASDLSIQLSTGLDVCLGIAEGGDVDALAAQLAADGFDLDADWREMDRSLSTTGR